MPPTRTLEAFRYRFSPSTRLEKCGSKKGVGVVPVMVATGNEIVNLADCDMDYPVDDGMRQKFRTKDGKMLTAHQWAVYDYVRKIPAGKVTTYKDVCIALGQGSPRSVGAALRYNPFAPYIPCHRIIASNHFIGGFYGEWGQSAGTGTQYHHKIDMLAKEGVGFTDKGYLLGGDALIWR